MPRNKVQAGLRSGRINGQDATTPIIITTKPAIYRFSNTGKNPFTLNGITPAVPLQKGCSVDLRIPAASSITVAPVTALGVFETVDTDRLARTGHFKTAAQILVSKKPRGNVYRIFNSGDNPFQTDPLSPLPNPLPPAPFSSAKYLNIPPKCSRDIAVFADELKIATTVKVTGAFDVVDSSADIRSGRFQFLATPDFLEYLIVDMSSDGSSADPANRKYRITNTGDDPFDVVLGPDKKATLASDQSIDLQFLCEKPESTVRIRTTDGKTASGIYDFI